MFKKLLFIIPLILILPSCEGKKGEKGDTGIQGPGTIEVLSGQVTSNDFIVTDSKILAATQVSVYMYVAGNAIQLPIFNPGGGFNVFYTVNGSHLEIFNAQAGSATGYVIVLILP